MAYRDPDRMILPIGCSCIVQFQLQQSRLIEFALSTVSGAELFAGPFDWLISTPDASAAVLEAREIPLRGLDELELRNGLAQARRQDGLYFWHINKEIGKPALQLDSLDELAPAEAAIVGKYRALSERFGAGDWALCCLWSNIQPNLQIAAGMVDRPWSDFHLTEARYAALRQACARLPAASVTMRFVCRPEDVSPDLHHRPDVHLLPLARSDAYKGEPDLFHPVFEDIFKATGAGDTLHGI